MKLLMLGGSKAQLPGIIRAQELGHQVVVCDYLKDSIGHIVANTSYLVSTFDKGQVLKVAKEEKIDGIMTLGTDQPVLTAAFVSKELGLPSLIDMDTALHVTNKIYMKKRFKENKIPTVDYVLYEKGVNEKVLKEIKGPVVVKPVDSQGQRGIYFLEDATLAVDYYDSVIEFSRESKILVEQYYPHDEITVSGWVKNDESFVLTITDRVTFDDVNRIGICLSHELPSKHMGEYGKELIDITQGIVEAFNIHNGPIYFQFLIGSEGIKVNEIACRIGGAYEASFMERVTGFDILNVQIHKALGLDIDVTSLNAHQVLRNKKRLSVQLFFVEPCKIAKIPEEKEVLALKGVRECGFNIHVGDELKSIENATARGGYVIIEAENKKELNQCLRNLYQVLEVKDDKGVNHIIHPQY